MSSLKSLLFDHSRIYTKRGGVAACRVVYIGLYLKSVRVYVFYLVLWTTRVVHSTCDVEVVHMLVFTSERLGTFICISKPSRSNAKFEGK